MSTDNELPSMEDSQTNRLSVLYGQLSNFVFEKKIGKGQFSEVHRVRCVADGSILALKKVQVLLMFLMSNVPNPYIIIVFKYMRDK